MDKEYIKGDLNGIKYEISSDLAGELKKNHNLDAKTEVETAIKEFYFKEKTNEQA